jgi:hypothetical protein
MLLFNLLAVAGEEEEEVKVLSRVIPVNVVTESSEQGKLLSCWETLLPTAEVFVASTEHLHADSQCNC